MYGKIIYYLDRVSPFWWVCVALVFVFTALNSIKLYSENKLSKSQVLSRTLFAPYLMMILVFTVFIRLPNNFFGYELMPFWSYREILCSGDRELIFENISNIAIFVPFGILFPLCEFKKNEDKPRLKGTLISGFLFSFIIELIQLVTKYGYFEFDDIFHNTLGVVFGELVFITVQKLIKKRGERK